MRQRGQRLEMVAKARRLLKAHRGRGLIARPGQLTQQRAAAPAEKTNRASNPLRVPFSVDTQVARRGAVPHLPVYARRKLLARLELPAAGAKAEDSRQRAN